MPNLLNPSGNPYVDEAIRRGLLDAGQYMGQAAQDPINLGKGLGAGLLGLSGNVQAIGNDAGNALLGLLSKTPVTGPLAASLVNYQGRSAPTEPELGQVFGADQSSPGYQVGMYGAPDATDLRRFVPDGLLAMTLLHGSPHKWSKPATMKELAKYMGTGEGAQAFGWGLYFAENPKVAGKYRHAVGNFDQLKKRADEVGVSVQDYQRMVRDGEIPSPGDPGGHLYEVDIDDEVIDQMLDWDAPLSEQPESVRRLIEDAEQREMDAFVRYFDSEYKSTKGWDNLTEREQNVIARSLEKDGLQIPAIMESRLRPGRNPEQTGEAFYKMLHENPEEASRILNQAGIPGIRFLDGGSRGMGSKGVGEIKIMPSGNGYEAMILAAPDSDWGGVLKSKKFDTKDAAQAWAEKEVYGTRNIVVFDPDSIINTVKRDGEEVFKKGLLSK